MARSAAEYGRTLEEPWEMGGRDIRPVRESEAPGSNPGPPTNPLRARRAKRLNFGRVRIVQ